MKIKAARDTLSKAHGSDILYRGGEERKPRNVEFITSQSLAIDMALGGGWPKGRIVEVMGVESSGKSTLCLHAIAEVLKQGGIAVFIDMEHALDPIYAKAVGVDIDNENFFLSQPMYAEQALQVAEAMVLAGADMVVVDSVASLVPKAEVEGEMGDAHVGLQARLMSQALRKLTGAVSKMDCVVIFTNQIREKIGNTYGSNKTTPGGRALKFYASVRVESRRIESYKGGDGVFYGAKHGFKTVKNKVFPPYREAEVDIIFGEGISPYGSLVDMAVEYGIVDKKGAWYSYGDIRLGQGRLNTTSFLKENEELYQEIDQKVRDVVFAPAPEEPVDDE